MPLAGGRITVTVAGSSEPRSFRRTGIRTGVSNGVAVLSFRANGVTVIVMFWRSRWPLVSRTVYVKRSMPE